ncbi:MAG: 2-phosphosulfolactate phosphatase [Firmicutes bacterium]|nr:2-phosphosulfolactate phosphatase [Bacillota bacterium]
MIVDVIPTLKELTPQKIYGKTAIVLDIFRCTSTIVTALANGCKEVVPQLSFQEVDTAAAKYPINDFLLAGEINGQKIPGWNLGNSPVEYTEYPVRDKTILLTTTNGTNAIKACKPAKSVLIGSFLNLSAVCSRAVTDQKDIVIVCAGTQGNIALEDIMAAGCHISRLKKYYQDVRLTDLSRTFYYLYNYFRDNLFKVLSASRSALNLQKLGYERDIAFCLQKNIYKIAPVLKNNTIQLNHPVLLSNDMF